MPYCLVIEIDYGYIIFGDEGDSHTIFSKPFKIYLKRSADCDSRALDAALCVVQTDI